MIIVALFILVLIPIFVIYFIWYVFVGHKQEIERRRAQLLEEERHLRTLQIANVDYMTSKEFISYVTKLLHNENFQVRETKDSTGSNIDIIAQKGGTTYAVMIKKYKRSVSRNVISDAMSGQIHYQCSSCMVITNNYFSVAAKEAAQSSSCELVDRDILANWILAFQSSEPDLILIDKQLQASILNEQTGFAGIQSTHYRSRRKAPSLGISKSLKKAYKANLREPFAPPRRRSRKKKWW
jgi:hypothetical protein